MADTVRVKGLKELQRSLKQADKEVRSQARFKWREVGDIVREDAASAFSHIDSGSAAGFKTRVRQRGVAVEQSRKRVTGKRGDYGAHQQRYLDQSADRKEGEVKDKLEQAIDDICDIVKGA